jgi:hypothetical protein
MPGHRKSNYDRLKPYVRTCGFRNCNNEVIHTYCKPICMKLERSAKAQDKIRAEKAAMIY